LISWFVKNQIPHELKKIIIEANCSAIFYILKINLDGNMINGDFEDIEVKSI